MMTMTIYRVTPGTLERRPVRRVTIGAGTKTDTAALSFAWPPCECPRCHEPEPTR